MCAVTIKIILLSLLLYKVSCEQLDNIEICKNLCKSCGGIASYVDDQCECYIDDGNQKNAECVGRIKRQADDLHLDFVNCKPTAIERPPSLCGHRRNPGRFGINDIDLVARYFLSGGPSNGIPILRSRCDNSGQQFQSTTPVEQLLDDFTNEPLDYYDLSTPSNRIEDPYYQPEQPRAAKPPCIPLSYVNRPISSSSSLYPCVYKCIKYPYSSLSSSSLPIHSSFATATSMHYPYNQFHSDFIKSTHLPLPQTPCNPCQTRTPYVHKSFQPQPGENKFMDAIYKSIGEQNIRKSMTNSQSWTDKINSVHHNSLFGGSTGSVIPPSPYNYPLGPYPTGSPVSSDMTQLQAFLAQQNSFLESLNQFLQTYHGRSTMYTHPSYFVGPSNNIVGAPAPMSTENTNWGMESSTPETYRTVTKTSDTKIQEENRKEVSNTEVQGVNVGSSGLSDERSHRLIPIINRRMKRKLDIKQ